MKTTKTRLPYTLQLEIIHFRMSHTQVETARHFGLSIAAVRGAMRRNADVVKDVREKLRKETVRRIVTDLRHGYVRNLLHIERRLFPEKEEHTAETARQLEEHEEKRRVAKERRKVHREAAKWAAGRTLSELERLN